MFWQAAEGRAGADPIDLGSGVARGINERGQIVGELAGGSLRNPSPSDRKAGTIVRVEAGRSGSRPERVPEVVAINDRGQMIGSVQGLTTEVYPVRGLLWEGGEAIDLGNLGAAPLPSRGPQRCGPGGRHVHVRRRPPGHRAALPRPRVPLGAGQDVATSGRSGPAGIAGRWASTKAGRWSDGPRRREARTSRQAGPGSHSCTATAG